VSRELDKRCLVLRHHVWSVRKEVPPSLRKIAGTRRWQKSTGTRDLAEACRLKHRLLAEYEALRQHWVRVSRGEALPSDPVLDAARAQGAWARENPDDENVEDFAHMEAEKTLPRGWVLEDPNLPAEMASRARTVFRAAKGEPLLTDLLDEYLAEGAFTDKTRSKYQHDVAAFLASSRARFAVEVTKRIARAYVRETLKQRYGTRGTVQAHLVSLRAFWRWLVACDHAEDNPWRDQMPKRGTPGFTDEESWENFEPAELARILDLLPEGTDVGDVTRIAALMGLRQDEVLSNVVVEEHAGFLCLRVVKGKTKNAKRTLPVHSALLPIIERRSKLPSLFPGLKAGRLRKVFSAAVDEAGVTDELKVFHSLRKWCATEMRRGRVDTLTLKQVLGHASGLGVTDRYVMGDLLGELREALEMVKLPSPALP
jgi:integrase